jgi:hypothetical protein
MVTPRSMHQHERLARPTHLIEQLHAIDALVSHNNPTFES